jgi:hypothetical protein
MISAKVYARITAHKTAGSRNAAVVNGADFKNRNEMRRIAPRRSDSLYGVSASATALGLRAMTVR